MDGVRHELLVTVVFLLQMAIYGISDVLSAVVY